MAAVSGTTAYTCAGGDLASGNFTSIPSGNYASITVTGVCNIQPDAVINVVGNINVAPGAVLDAQSAPSTITVGHNVTAGSGSFLGLGCQPTNSIGMFAGVPCAVEPAGHRRQRDADQHHGDRPGRPGPDRRSRRKQGWAEPQLLGTRPGVSGGFIPGEVNHVGGKATGQCASLV